MIRRSLAALAALACIAAVAPTAATAQAFPSKPIRLVVAYAPGGLPDTVARLLAQRLQASLGQPVVVENRTGAGGSVAVSAVLQAPADGHTLLVTDGPMLAIAPLVSRQMSYDAGKDFQPVSLVGTAPLFLAVNSSVKANTLDEFVALAKSRPGALNIGSAGIGSIHHLTAEAMKEGLGIFVTHIPFKGSGASVPALIGGQIDAVFASPPALAGFVQSGQVKLLATNAPKRSQLYPAVPALGERVPGFDFSFTVVVLARSGTPADSVTRLNSEIVRIVRSPDMLEPLRVAGVDPVGAGPQELATAMRREGDRIAKAARHAGLKPE
jgi:tripartite-type tricarboxylate transporter receptor subunit TctC